MEDRFYISDWCIDPPDCVISRGEVSVKLEPKVMDLLVYMSRNPEHVHSREELLDNVWPGMVVSDEALTNAIIKLRKVFKDDSHHPRVIKTLPKRGYRLIAGVTTVEPQQTDSFQKLDTTAAGRSKLGRISAAALVLMVIAAGIIWFTFGQRESVATLSLAESTDLALPDMPSIAVLPFMNIGNEVEHSYFSDGITDDLITDLSKLSGLFVISRNSTFRYKGRAVDAKQVANQLGVRYILEGSVRRIDNRVRVNTQLIDGISGGQLWAERYDGDLQDVFALQDRITGKIISALAVRVTTEDHSRLSETRTTNMAAYDEFLKGWELHWRFTRDDFARSEAHLKKAIELDPNYARAHEALALIYWQAWKQKWHVNSGSRLAGWVRARQELDASMSQPTPLAFSLRSAMHLYNRRYQQAIDEARKAINLNPSSATGYLALADAQAFNGEPLEAISSARKALRRDPNFPAPYLTVQGRSYFDMQQYDQAVASLNRAVSINPDDDESYVLLLATYGELQQMTQADEILQRLNGKLKRASLPEFTLDWPKNRWPYRNHEDRDRLIDGLKKAGVPEW